MNPYRRNRRRDCKWIGKKLRSEWQEIKGLETARNGMGIIFLVSSKESIEDCIGPKVLVNC